ncbi:MAG: hypothetical protein HYX96_06360 [Chloroflexi bacterium]|nr:hypothetical protein [Chloroflexota bacterium]
MAKKENEKSQPPSESLQKIEKRLELFDQRLDNIDSIVTAVAERIMKQPIILSVTCSKCGNKISIAVVANERPG